MITFNGLAQIGLFLAGYLLSPTILIWGWARWIRLPKQNTVAAVLSLCGFILATASALVAVSGMVYSFAIGGFQYYDPRLMKIMGVGGLLSLVSLILGLSGLWRANPLRWHAPVLAISTFAFWIAAAAGE